MALFSQQPSTDLSTDTTKPEKKEHPLAEIVRFSIIAIIIVVPIRLFIAQPFIVSGASMEETFYTGEYLIIDQVTYHFDEPARGEVIIFRYPRDPSKFFIKRVIGLPGETISIIDNEVTISNQNSPNGFVLDEPYIAQMTPTAPFTTTLSEDEYFVMGDNRDKSSDSRTWGPLEEDKIIGRAWVRLFPPQSFEFFPGAITSVTNTSN